jgi:serine/threonine protein kinase/tetratricopeptide (TPR) repeat protein
MTELSPAEAIFFAAQERPPGEQAAFLDQACAGDASLRARIERMLAAQSHLGGFLDQPQAAATPDIPRNGPAEPPAEVPGAVIAGKYKLLQRIGEGGMGRVWMAEQLVPVKRRVAMKLIHIERGSSQTILARFEAERQAIALMDHPHIAKLLDAGTVGPVCRTGPGGSPEDAEGPARQPGPSGRPFFVMELIKGTPLNEYCDQHKLSIADRLHLFMQVCSAVQHAHQKGIIHRDLKPSNILVEAHDARPVPKVIDFGLAKAISGQALTAHTFFTAFGTVAGTPLYMAPEQANFSAIDVDTRADIYALGVILYELLTGTTPIEREQLKTAAYDEVLRVIRESDPPTPSKRLSSTASQPSVAADRRMEPLKLCRLLQGDLDWIVMKALAKERDRRYESASGLARDIERFLNHEPVLAGPPGAWYRLMKLVRRRRGPLLAAACVALALLGGVATVIAVQVRANRELTATNAELTEEKAKVEARNEELADEKTRVKDRFMLAARAIHAFHTGVSEDVLLKKDQFKELRQQLLKRAAAFYEQLEKLVRDQQDEESRRVLGNASCQLADLTGRIGSREEALAVHEKALAIRQQLADASPAVTDYQRDLALSHTLIADLLWRTGKTKEALESHQKALAIRQKLADANPTVAQDQYSLVSSQINIAWLASQTGGTREALECYRKTLAIQQKLVDANPTVAEYQRVLASIHGSIGLLQSQSGKTKDALESYQKDLAIREKLADANPMSAEDQSNVAASHSNIGKLLSDTEKPAQALMALESALARYRKLVDAYPTVTDYQQDLAETYNLLGQVLLHTRKAADALKAFEKALAIRQQLVDANPTDASFKCRLAAVHHNIGLVLDSTGYPAEALVPLGKALAIQQKLAQANPTVTQYQIFLAKHLHSFGQSLTASGKPAEALNAHESALVICKKLADANPTVKDFQYILAGNHWGAGKALAATGKPAEAMKAFEKTLAIYKKLADADPTAIGLQIEITRSYEAIGEMLLKMGKSAEAARSYESVIAFRQKLAQEHPESPHYAAELGGCLNNLAVIDISAKRFEKARARLREAIVWQRKALAANPANATYRHFLGNHLGNLIRAARELGDTEGMAEAERELAKVLGPPPAKEKAK